MSGLWSHFRQSRYFWAVIGLMTLVFFNALFSDNFFKLEIREGNLYGTLIDILHQGSIVMLLGIGMTLVIATKGIDLSVGSIMAMSGSLAAVLLTQYELPFFLAGIIGLLVACLAGLWNGCLITYLGVQPIIATLILMVIGRGLAMLIADGQVITFEDPAFVTFGNGSFCYLPLSVWMVMLAFIAVSFLMKRSSLGLFIEATGDNEAAARLAGLQVNWVKLFAYMLCGLLAGLAGLMAAGRIKAADPSQSGQMLELDAIIAVVVGGTALTGGRFTLLGTIIGALLIQTLTTTMYIQGVASAISPMPKALVILVVCLMQSKVLRDQVQALWLKQRSSV